MRSALGTVERIRRYPLKSTGGERLERVDIEARGLAGDRLYAVRDAEGRFGSGRTPAASAGCPARRGCVPATRTARTRRGSSTRRGRGGVRLLTRRPDPLRHPVEARGAAGPGPARRRAGTRVPTLPDRLPADLREGPRRPEAPGGPFRRLYRTQDEWACEIADRTVHAVRHIGWVPDGKGRVPRPASRPREARRPARQGVHGGDQAVPVHRGPTRRCSGASAGRCSGASAARGRGSSPPPPAPPRTRTTRHPSPRPGRTFGR